MTSSTTPISSMPTSPSGPWPPSGPAPTNDARAMGVGRPSKRAGGVAALTAAATFIFGIGLFATSLQDYTTGDPTPQESVAFLVGHQGTLFLWYLVILLVFGAALVPLVLSLHRNLRPRTPRLADAGAVFGAMWAALMFATGMIANVGITAVADLAGNDLDRAATVWATIDVVTDGLGGGNELVGGAWVLLVSLAALRNRALPRALNVLGLLCAGCGLLTVVPGLSDLGMGFGLGLIVWFIGVGVALLRSDGIDRQAANALGSRTGSGC